MKILYLGYKNGNSLLRAETLKRLGHEVLHLDESQRVPGGGLAQKFHYETGGLFAAGAVARQVLEKIPSTPFDLVWVDNGRYVGPKLIRTLKERYGKVINYNADNPFVYRDRFSWLLLRRALPEYDLFSTVRRSNIAEAEAAGVKRVLIDYRRADEVAHRRRELSAEEVAKWSNEVVFVGTAFEDRGAFMLELVKRKVPLALYGSRWDRQPEWSELQPYWRGPETKNGQEYSAALLGAKVCLGMLSAGNKDLHTYRSLEVPSLGTVFCAPRTPDHETLYVDGEEAVFWNDAAECAEACLRLVADPARREKIALAGHERNLRNGHFNEPFCQKVIDATFGKDVPLVPPVGPV